MSTYEWKLSKRGERRQPSFIRQLVKYLSLPGIVSLGGGLPHPSLNSLKEMKMTLQGHPEITIPASSIEKATAYVPTLGHEPLRQWIYRYMAREHEKQSQRPKPSDFEVIVGNGSQDLLQRLFDLLLDPEDTILVEEHSYSGALAALWPIGCEIVGIGADSFGLDPLALQSLLQSWPSSKKAPKAIYLVPVANNPTGASLSRARKQEIYKLASLHNLIIIEDDPYWNLNFPSTDALENRTSFWSMDVEERVIRLESLSKITAVGYRVGWACGPKKVIEKLMFDLEAGAQSGSGIAQLIVFEMVQHLFNADSALEWDTHVALIRQTYYSRWLIVEEALNKHLKSLAEWKSPSGGMFAWVRLLGLEDSQDFVKNLAEDHLVLVVPGSAFTSKQNEKSPFIRISYSFCSPELIEPSIAKLAISLTSYLASHNALMSINQ
jgi:kynurenine/2-aminoadipate aminotransferase